MKPRHLAAGLICLFASVCKSQEISILSTDSVSSHVRSERRLAVLPADATKTRKVYIVEGQAAFIEEKEGKQFFVLNDKWGEPFDEILCYNFSPNHQRTAYVASSNTTNNLIKYYAVIDGVKSEAYDKIDPEFCGFGLVFSSDSKRVGYNASIGTNRFAIIIGEDLKTQKNNRLFLIFSPDSRHIWYSTNTEGIEDLYEDEILRIHGGGNEREGLGDFKYYPDGKHLAFIVPKGKKRLVVVDGKEGELFDRITHHRQRKSRRMRRYGAVKGKELWWKVLTLDPNMPANGKN